MEAVRTKSLLNDRGVRFEIEEGALLVASRSESLEIGFCKFAEGSPKWVKSQGGAFWLSYAINWNAYIEARGIKSVEELIDGSKLYQIQTHCTSNNLSDRYDNFIYIRNGVQVGVCGKSMWASDQYDVVRYQSRLIERLNKELAGQEVAV
jgi:hypothetical protein